MRIGEFTKLVAVTEGNIRNYYHDKRRKLPNGYERNNVILGIMRAMGKYTGKTWIVTAGNIDYDVLFYLRGKYNRDFIKLENVMNGNTKLYDSSNEIIDIAHLIATLDGYISVSPIPKYWSGWGGDLVTGLNEAQEHMDTRNVSAKEAVSNTLGKSDSTCSMVDLRADADGALIAQSAINGKPISESISSYYQYAYRSRYYHLRNSLRASSKENLRNTVNEAVSNIPLQLGLSADLSNSIENEGAIWFANLLYDEYQ